jgi:hypothetical protein
MILFLILKQQWLLGEQVYQLVTAALVTLLVSFRKNQSSGSTVRGENTRSDSMAEAHKFFVYNMIY